MLASISFFKSNQWSSANPQWGSGIGDELQTLRSGLDSFFRSSKFFYPYKLNRLRLSGTFYQGEISREISCRKTEMRVWSMEMNAHRAQLIPPPPEKKVFSAKRNHVIVLVTCAKTFLH